MARWDRPPDPHDWRFFVGGLGRILIVTGLLMFGFVAYQLWGTGIETARAQAQLENGFEQRLGQYSDGSDGPATGEPSGDAPNGGLAGPVLVDGPLIQLTPVRPPDGEPSDLEPGDTPISTVPTEDAAPLAAPPPLPPIRHGGRDLQAQDPRIGKVGGEALYVTPGVDLDNLKGGPGHYPTSPLPGQLGNASVAGHRTTWGEPFRHVDELQPGDDLVVTMLNGEQYVYVVTYTEIVDPSDFYVVTTQDPNVAMLTLTSCHPVFTSKQRIVVHAELDWSRSGIVTEPFFYELDEPAPAPESAATQPAATAPPESAGADDPGLVVPSATVVQNSAPPANTPSATTPSASTPSASTPSSVTPSSAPPSTDASGTASTVPAAPADGEIEDAFGKGWFHDKAAFPRSRSGGLC